MLGVSPSEAGYTIHDGFCDGCGEPETVAWPHPSFAAPPELPLFFPPDVPSSAITGAVPTMTTDNDFNPHLHHASAPVSAPVAAPAPHMVDAASTATAAAPAPATLPDAVAIGPAMQAASNAAPAAQAPAAVSADARGASVAASSLP